MKKLWIVLTVACIAACSTKDTSQSKEDRFIDSLINVMTVEEKLGQLTLYTSGWDVTGPTLNENYKNDVKAGRCGNLFNAHTVKYNRELQRIAVEETRLKIPLLFGYDVIHGHRTIFPIPLGEAASWDLESIEKSARCAAKEAAASGLNWAYNPMVDIARDPRWGRVAEGNGEDTFLGSLIGAAKVRGYQGKDLADPFTIAACVKHFAAYGAAQAGRDYHTVDMSLRTLYDTYLPPYKAAIEAGAVSVMTSFNELDGQPATGNKFLMNQILRKQWGFDGVVVTDYTSMNEMIPHGYAEDEKHAGELALNAGVDMDMQGGIYISHLQQSLNEGKVTIQQINDAVRRVLTLKKKLGLFDDPYRYLNEQREKETLFSDEIMSQAVSSAQKSIVLLENKLVEQKPLLPLPKNIKSIGLIGPLGDNQLELLGCWHASGDVTKVVTVKAGLQNEFPETTIRYAKGCDINGTATQGFAEALSIASQVDVVVLAVGEAHTQSGEAASRSDLNLPGVQEELVRQLLKKNKKVVVLAMAGRPLTIPWIAENVPALLYTWHLGTRAGEAIADVLSGDYNPSGKLPITIPRSVGQLPIHYNVKNTGRPFDPNNSYTSRYLDITNEPLYVFGYGKSYSQFDYGEIQLSKVNISKADVLQATIQVTNRSEVSGQETVQLYVRDVVGSVTRPVKELKGFQKIYLKPNETRNVVFELTVNDLAFYRADMTFGAEPGEFTLFIGGNSKEVKQQHFRLIDKSKNNSSVFEFSLETPKKDL